MPRPAEFQTSDLDLSAAIMVATGRQPDVLLQQGNALAMFEFPGDQATMDVVISYASGELKQPVKRFAACRSWLFRQIRGVCP